MRNSVRKLQSRMIIILAIIILSIILFTMLFLLTISDRYMKNQMMSLIASSSRQLELNINSYLEEVEDTAALMFSDEIYYAYDATDESIEEYDKIKSQEAITDRIVDLGMMKNFSDFGVVYSNGARVGWISQVTTAMYPDGEMYNDFSSTIVNEKSNDGWSFGKRDNYDRLFYTKRLNKNAILLVSFYNRELENVFQRPEQLEDMIIRLVDRDNKILYSSDEGEIGSALPGEVTALATAEDNVAVTNDDLIVTVNFCSNSWRVICSIPNEVILRESNRMKNISIIVSIGLLAVFMVISLLLTKRLTNPIGGEINKLSEKAATDLMTGLTNKASFETEVGEMIAGDNSGLYKCFIMIDMDNFKNVNDRLGHAKGDDVIRKFSGILRSTFDESFEMGRLGGDEFAVFKLYYIREKHVVHDIMNTYMENLYKQFAKTYPEEKESCKLSLSVGIAIENMVMDFTELYKEADEALYHSKESGKDQYTFYEDLADKGGDGHEGRD